MLLTRGGLLKGGLFSWDTAWQSAASCRSSYSPPKGSDVRRAAWYRRSEWCPCFLPLLAGIILGSDGEFNDGRYASGQGIGFFSDAVRRFGGSGNLKLWGSRFKEN